MAHIDIDNLIHTCDFVSNKVIKIEGRAHGASWLFNQCMRAFDNSKLPAQAITFAVYFNAPVMRDGFVTIYPDGRREMRIA